MSPARIPTLTVVVALLLSGCAGWKEARAGEDALGRGDFDGAVTSYEQAVRDSPGDEDYRNGLTRARHQAALAALSQGDGARNAGDLNRAVALYSKADGLEKTADTTARIAAVQQDKSGAQEILSRAQTDATVGRLEPALTALRSIERYSPTFPALAPLLDHVSRTLCDRSMAAAQVALDRDSAQAKADAQQALVIRPGDPAAAALLQRIEARQRSEQAVVLAAAALSTRRFRDAVDLFGRAVGEDRTFGVAQAGLEGARLSLSEALRADADAAIRQGKEGHGLSLLREAYSQLSPGPSRTALESRAQALVEKLAARLESKGDAATRGGLAGAAWAHYHSAERLRGSSSRTQPDLAPLLTYRVSLSTDGRGLSSMVLADLEGALRSAGLPAGVALVEGGAAEADLKVTASGARFQHSVPEVEQRGAEYVARIDQVRNPRFFELERRAHELSDRLRVVNARLDGERDALRARAMAVERAERDLQAARRGASVQAHERAAQLQREAGEAQARSAVHAGEVRRLEGVIKDLRTAQQKEKIPRDREGSLAKLKEADKQLEAAQREQRADSQHSDQCLQQARALIENPPSTPEVRREEAELARARGDQDDFRARVVAPLENDRERLGQELQSTRGRLADTPDRVAQPVMAVFTYPVEHHLLRASAAGTVVLVDRLLAEERLRLAPTAQREARDTTFPGAFVRGEPDLILAPDPLELPPESAFENDLAADLAGQSRDRLLATLAAHTERFGAAARRSQGDARLHYWILATASGQPLDAGTLAEAREVILRASGWDNAIDQVSLDHLDD